MDSVEQGSVSVAPKSRYDSTRVFPRESLKNRFVWLTLALGLVCTVAWSVVAARNAREAVRLAFEERSRIAAEHVEQSFRAPLEALYGIHALGCSLPDVDQRRFELFAGKLMERYPSLAALELFDVVRAEERDAFERRMTAQLGYGFAFREPSSAPPHQMVVAQRRDRHVVLTRLLPFHSQLLGLDLTFDPLRREQIATASLAGAPTVTGKFRLVEDAEGVFSRGVRSAVRRRRGAGRPCRARPAAARLCGRAVSLGTADERCFGRHDAGAQRGGARRPGTRLVPG